MAGMVVISTASCIHYLTLLTQILAPFSPVPLHPFFIWPFQPSFLCSDSRFPYILLLERLFLHPYLAQLLFFNFFLSSLYEIIDLDCALSQRLAILACVHMSSPEAW